MKTVFQIFILTVFSIFLVLSLNITSPAPDSALKYIQEHGTAETGATNLVTSIYLGYRAFDTLGETIVLLVSVSGVVFLIGKK